uniref:TIR domain-containing protein n=1 Tax=Lepisosteus oculatus TaxID=7918 RepID=W5N735_LEPOC
IWNYSDASLLFGEELGKLGLIKYLVAVLDHEPYKSKQEEKNVKYLLKASLCTLHNLAKVPENRPLLRQDRGVGKIAYYTRVEDGLLKVVSIMLLGYIIDEDESDVLMDESGAVEIMVKILQGALDSKDQRCCGYRASEIAEGLSLIATCEKNKEKIFRSGALPVLMEMMESKNSHDKLFAAKVVWQLAFDASIRDEMRENESLMNLLESLSKDKNKAVRNTAHGAKWVIGKQAEEKSKNKEKNSSQSDHFLLPYQEGRLTIPVWENMFNNSGLRLWMDVEQMAGSTLQAMAEAVEQAYAVLICISSKYKESPSCRTEAEYTFQLRKQIVPLMMEKNYRPDGWLGALLGAKLWIDFSNDSNFEESISQLIKEIETYTPMNKCCPISGLERQHKPPTEKSAKCQQPFFITQINVPDINVFMKTTSTPPTLDVFFIFIFFPLSFLIMTAPEFFFTSLRKDVGFNSLTEVLLFTQALEKIN